MHGLSRQINPAAGRRNRSCFAAPHAAGLLRALHRLTPPCQAQKEKARVWKREATSRKAMKRRCRTTHDTGSTRSSVRGSRLTPMLFPGKQLEVGGGSRTQPSEVGKEQLLGIG